MKKWSEIYLKHSKGIASTDRTNVINLGKGIKYTFESPIQIEIDSEYFKIKFEEILGNHHHGLYCESNDAVILNELIECLKNSEEK